MVQQEDRSKDKGEEVRPICIHCKEKLERSYRNVKNTKGNWQKEPYGWVCVQCCYQIFDKPCGNPVSSLGQEIERIEQDLNMLMGKLVAIKEETEEMK